MSVPDKKMFYVLTLSVWCCAAPQSATVTGIASRCEETSEQLFREIWKTSIEGLKKKVPGIPWDDCKVDFYHIQEN